MGLDGKLVIPEGGSCHFHQITVNGVPVTALRDTCSTKTMMVARLFFPEQYLPGQVCRITQAQGQDFFHPMVLVSLE